MKTVELKTNIMCGSCIASATPVLNEKLGHISWNVDTANPDKILSVKTDLSEQEVIKAVEQAGYKAQPLK